jgi:hypothetical protein
MLPTVVELTRPVDAPPASLLATLAERGGISLVEARRTVRAGLPVTSRTKAFVEAFRKLGEADRAALVAALRGTLQDAGSA